MKTLLSKICANSRFLFPVCCLALCLACGNNRSDHSAQPTPVKNAPQRIISLNGAVSEIISDLGHEHELVGRDVTSTYPEFVSDSVPNLGHVSAISMEAVMNLKPTLILGISSDADRDLLQKIETSGIEHQFFERDFSVEGTKKLIREVADMLKNPDYEFLLKNIDTELGNVIAFETRPKVLFIYARGAGSMMVAGTDTPFEKIINLSGGENAITSFSGFKPLTPEALINHNPDILLLFDSGMQSIGGVDSLLKIPGVSQTTAGKNRAFIAMEGNLLSGFGPRLGLAAHELNRLLIPYAK